MITLMMLSMLHQRLEFFLKIDALLILLRASYACTALRLAPIGELGKGAFPTNSHTVVATDLTKPLIYPIMVTMVPITSWLRFASWVGNMFNNCPASKIGKHD